MLYKFLILLTVISVSSCMEGLKNKFLTSISDNVQDLNFAKATEDLNEGLLKGPTGQCANMRTHSPEAPIEARKIITDREVHLDTETFPPPKKIKGKKRMWGTNYYTRIQQNNLDGSRHPLYDIRDRAIEHKGERSSLTRGQWCSAGIEGSVRVAYTNGDIITYNYQDKGSQIRVGCKKRWMEIAKFRLAKSRYGEGVRSYSLVPYRTIAVKDYNIPHGSLVYIPAAKGKVVKLPNGSTMVHDGYFFVGDTGGVLDKEGKNQIDFFTGGEKSKKPFHTFIKSTSSAKFEVQIVDDEPLRQKFLKMHKKRY